jgi:hypothetical protein
MALLSFLHRARPHKFVFYGQRPKKSNVLMGLQTARRDSRYTWVCHVACDSLYSLLSCRKFVESRDAANFYCALGHCYFAGRLATLAAASGLAWNNANWDTKRNLLRPIKVEESHQNNAKQLFHQG